MVGCKLPPGDATYTANYKALFGLILAIYICANFASAQSFGNGILMMEVHKNDFHQLEPFSVECFYFDNPNNSRTGDFVSFKSVPKNAKKRVELTADSDLLIQPSTSIRVSGIGSIQKWDVIPRKKGDFYLILYYTIEGYGKYPLESKMIRI